MALQQYKVIITQDLKSYSVSSYDSSISYVSGDTIKGPSGDLYKCIVNAPAGTSLSNLSHYEIINKSPSIVKIDNATPLGDGTTVQDPETGIYYTLSKLYPAGLANAAAVTSWLQLPSNGAIPNTNFPVVMDYNKAYPAGTKVIDPSTGKEYTLSSNYAAGSSTSPASLTSYLENPNNSSREDFPYGSTASYTKSYKRGDVVKDPITGIEYILTKDVPANTTGSQSALSSYLQNQSNAIQSQPVAMDYNKSYPSGTEVIDPVTGKKYTLASNYIANTAGSNAALSTYLQNPANTYPAQSTTNINGMTSPEVSKSGNVTLSKTELSVAISGNNSNITFAPISEYGDGAILFIDVGNYTGITIHPNAGASIFPDAVNTARNLAPNSTFMYRKQGTTWKWIA